MELVTPADEHITLAELVSSEIRRLFDSLASDIGSGYISTEGMAADEVAGIPMHLFTAEQHLQRAWREFVERA